MPAIPPEQSSTLPRKKGRFLVEVSEAEEKFLPAPRVLDRYSVSQMTLHRWLKNPEMGFPVPTYFGRYRYWRLSELLAYERRCASRVVAAE